MSPTSGGGRKGGGKADAQQTGTAFGTQVMRLSGIHGFGMIASNILTFAAAIVIANFSSPAEFGQLGLLQFFAGLMTLLFTLAVKQGTLKRTFGGGDDDDDDDDEDEDISLDPKHSFGTGLIAITIVSAIGTALALIFRVPITDTLLGGNADPNLLVWAAIAGGAGALYRLTSIAIWIERRPYPYIAVETSKPVFTLAAVVPLLIAGLGVEGAILGQAIGTVLATLLSLVILRSSWKPSFDFHEAREIYKKGAIRIPLVLSMWVVSSADIFILSRFVSHEELGTYHLASRAAFLVAVLPGGYRKALRPLQKTPMFNAVEDEYGVGTARGIQFGYFWLMLVGTLLITTVGAHALLRIAPESYADSAPLIPIIAAGLVAPTVYRMINKSVKYADKRVPFIIGAVCAAFLFVGLSLLLVAAARRDRHAAGDDRRLRAAGDVRLPPLAARPQPDPDAVADALRLGCGGVADRLAPRPRPGRQPLRPDAARDRRRRPPGSAAWSPSAASRARTAAPLWMMFKGLRRKGRAFDGATALEALSPRERRALRRAIKRDMKPRQGDQGARQQPDQRAQGRPGGDPRAPAAGAPPTAAASRACRPATASARGRARTSRSASSSSPAARSPARSARQEADQRRRHRRLRPAHARDRPRRAAGDARPGLGWRHDELTGAAGGAGGTRWGPQSSFPSPLSPPERRITI